MFNDLPFDLGTAFDPLTLRAYPLHPLQVEGALLYLKSRLHHLDLPEERRCHYLAQYALLLRLNQSYDQSIAAFLELLERWQTSPLTKHPQQPQRLVANRIRLANTYHLQGDFTRSNAAFSDLLCQSEQWSVPLKRAYQHFLWQHLGKNAFDQGRWEEALGYFEKALQSRQQQQLSQDLIDSSRLALSRCSDRIL